MKKILASIFALFTIISLSSCENNSEEKNNYENNEILEIESDVESENQERVKSQKELDYPERFDPMTGESIPKPL